MFKVIPIREEFSATGNNQNNKCAGSTSKQVITQPTLLYSRALNARQYEFTTYAGVNNSYGLLQEMGCMEPALGGHQILGKIITIGRAQYNCTTRTLNSDPSLSAT